jgi:hypothetical protein
MILSPVFFIVKRTAVFSWQNVFRTENKLTLTLTLIVKTEKFVTLDTLSTHYILYGVIIFLEKTPESNHPFVHSVQKMNEEYI